VQVTALVWYAAYGSNLLADRLRCYLAGGTPPRGLRRYPGCRDPSPPRRSVPVLLPGGIYFALESLAWTGGLALYDPLLPGEAAARAYLITAGQFADVVAQEMYREPDGRHPGGRTTAVDEAVRNGRVELGPGRYETLVYAGARDGYPVLTFTAPWHAADVALSPPAPAYLALLARGLRESHHWTAGQIAGYLGGRPGVAGRWSPDELTALAEAALVGVAVDDAGA
jgi:hypothetical protein